MCLVTIIVQKKKENQIPTAFEAFVPEIYMPRLQFFIRMLLGTMALTYFNYIPIPPLIFNVNQINLIIVSYYTFHIFWWWYYKRYGIKIIMLRLGSWIDILAAVVAILCDPFAIPPMILLLLIAAIGNGIQHGLYVIAESMIGALILGLASLVTHYSLLGKWPTYNMYFYLFLIVVGVYYSYLLVRRIELMKMEAMKISEYDSLTGIRNRRAFLNAAEYLLSLSVRSTIPLVFIFADLDNFKNVNDKFGHEMGDKVLKHFSEMARSIFRKSDIIARYGGDEFVMILTNASLGDAELAVQRLQNEFRIWARNSGLQTGVSFGMAMVSKGENNLDDILRRADAALYESKSKGCEISKVAPIVETKNGINEGASFSEAAQLRSIPVTHILRNGSGDCHPPEQPEDPLQNNLFNQLEKKILDMETANQQLRILVEEHRLQFQNILDVVFMIGVDLNILSISPSVEILLGYKAEEFIGQPVSALSHILTPQSLKRAITNLSMMLNGKNIPVADYEFVTKDGTLKHAEIHGSPLIRNGQVVGTISVARDITDRKKAEEALLENEALHRQREERYRNILDNMEEAYYEVDLKGNLTFFNTPAVSNLGYTDDEMMGMNFRQYVDKASEHKVFEAFHKVFLTGESSKGIDWELISKAGEKKPIESSISLMRDTQGHPIGFRGIIRDITDRKKTEEALRESEEKYRLIFEYSPLGHFYFDQKGVIVTCNDNFVKLIGSSREAIVGINMLLLPDKKLVKSIQKALNGDTAFYEDVYYSTTAGKATPVRAFFAPIKMGDKSSLGGVAIIEDITNYKRAEEDLKKSLEQLRRAMLATIQALSQIMETKDPYTSGHQKRTTNLARAIATEMHLPSDQIEGIRVAGAIHDIGKLSVPAEILSKPSKLAAAEYSLIKEHAHQGYEILKDVESPWPLAEIVHQHHERMNGSGYPRGLEGENILIEARILAVADVVEAMASYRPYRPALGIDKALEEIEKNKGVLYDILVADTCLHLFKEKGFKID